MKNNQQQIEIIKAKIVSALVPLIDNDYVLLDTPNYCNIGDNLIWQGELDFLDSEVSQYKLRYSANVVNVNLNKVGMSDVILMQGGGNFGDLYPICQELRKLVVERFPNNRIVFLPQTVFYNDKTKLAEDCAVFNKHKDIHICARDKESYDLLARYIDESKLLLLPDMAFCMNISFSQKKTGRALYMKRIDGEFDKSLSFNHNGMDISDWPTYPSNKFLARIQNYLFMKERLLSVFLSKTFMCFLVSDMYGLKWRRNRQRYVKMGINFLSKYDEIHTTRLHGMILAILLGKKVYILDNNHQKCKRYYDTWLTDFDNVVCK